MSPLTRTLGIFSFGMPCVSSTAGVATSLHSWWLMVLCKMYATLQEAQVSLSQCGVLLQMQATQTYCAMLRSHQVAKQAVAYLLGVRCEVEVGGAVELVVQQRLVPVPERISIQSWFTTWRSQPAAAGHSVPSAAQPLVVDERYNV